MAIFTKYSETTFVVRVPVTASWCKNIMLCIKGTALQIENASAFLLCDFPADTSIYMYQCTLKRTPGYTFSSSISWHNQDRKMLEGMIVFSKRVDRNRLLCRWRLKQHLNVTGINFAVLKISR